MSAHRGWPMALGLIAWTLAAGVASHPRGATAGTLPYRLAFDRAQFSPGDTLEVSPDGRRVAFVIQRNPANMTERQRIETAQRRGLFYPDLGSRVQVADMKTGATVQICPGEANTWRPSWSRDGENLAFFSDEGGVAQLWNYSVRDGKCRRVSAAILKLLDYIYADNGPKWSADGQTLFVPLKSAVAGKPGLDEESASTQANVTVYRSGEELLSAPHELARQPAGERPDSTIDIGAIDFASGKARILVDSRSAPAPRLLQVSASGRWVSYLSIVRENVPNGYQNTTQLAVVPAAGGSIHVIDPDLPEFADVIMSSQVNYCWHPTEDRLIYARDNRLWVVDLTAGEPKKPRELAPELGDVEPTIHWFSRDGRFVVAGLSPQLPSKQSAMLGGDPQGLALVPLQGGRAREIRFDASRWNYDGILLAGSGTMWQPDSKSITARMRERATGESAIVRLDPFSGKQSVLWKGLAKIGGRRGGWAAGGQHDSLAAFYQDYATAPDIYRFNADFSRKTRVSHIEPRFAGVNVGKVEVFETTVPLHDGRLAKARTSVLLPQGAKRGDRRPGIVFFYPGEDFSSYAQGFGGELGLVETPLLFTSRGYVALLTDVKVTPFGQPGNPIKEMTDSLLPQIFRAAELGYVDVERLGLRSNSYGGYGAAAIASYTNVFRAAVPSNGPYDIPGEYGMLAPPGAPDNIAYYEAGQGRMGVTLWDGFKRYIDNSPYYQADKIFTPILIIQGENDTFAQEGKKLFVALRRLGKPAQLALYAGEGHVLPDWSAANAIDASQRIMAFFEKHLGPPAH